MSISLIIPIGADNIEYENYMPYIFNFAPDGISLCIKSIQGLDLNRFDNIYFTILEKYDKKYYLSLLLKLQFKKLGLSNAKVVVLDEKADIFVIIGTSLNVYPAAGLLHYVPRGAEVYLIDPKPVDTHTSRSIHVIQKGASEGVAELKQLLGV